MESLRPGIRGRERSHVVRTPGAADGVCSDQCWSDGRRIPQPRFVRPPSTSGMAGRAAAAEASAGRDEVFDEAAGEVANGVVDEAAADATESGDAGSRSVSRRMGVLDELAKTGLAKTELSPVTEQRRVLARRAIDLSATAVMDYTKCPRLYYLRHYLGVPEQLLDQWVPSRRSDTGRSRPQIQPRHDYGCKTGDLLHRLIAHEVYGPGDPRTEALVKSLLPPAELPLLNTYVERVNAHLSALQSLGYEDRLRSLPRNARRCEVELDLVVDSTDQYAVRFTGFIDMLVSTEAGRWRILDFKTNAVGGMDIARFTREHLYDLQMELYMAVAGLALSRAGRSDTIEKAEIV